MCVCVCVCVGVAGGLAVLTLRSAAFYNADITSSDHFMSVSLAAEHTHVHICTCTDSCECVCTHAHVPAALTHAASALWSAHIVARRGLYL